MHQPGLNGALEMPKVWVEEMSCNMQTQQLALCAHVYAHTPANMRAHVESVWILWESGCMYMPMLPLSVQQCHT